MISPKLSYLFYDIETTGLDKAFDQVLQFAAIRTDQELNELSREQFYVKLSPDVIPSPHASITHRISIARAQSGLIEGEAIQKIHQLMNEAGTISCGYNTLGFDDEFLRFSFYRHLLPPYTHQYANGCGRMDIYPLTVMYFLYQNSILKWPNNNNKPSLKLADLNTANQFFAGSAHDAMVDVEVTLALAKCLMEKRKVWDYLLGYFDKNINQARINELSNQTGLLIDGKLGAELAYQWPMLYLGQHTLYKNQGIYLRLDSETLSLTTEENIADNTWVFRKKLAETGFLLPMREHYLEKLDVGRLHLIDQNLKWLQDNPEILKAIELYHKNYIYPVIENLDVDAALYAGGFLSREEEQLCQQFHRVGPYEKAKVILLFENENLRSRAIRFIGRYYPDCLPERFQEIFDQYLNRVWGAECSENPIINYKGGPRLTAQECLNKIKALRTQEDFQLDAEQNKLLNELQGYLVNHAF